MGKDFMATFNHHVRDQLRTLRTPSFFVHPSSHRLDRTQKFLLTLSFAHTLVDLKISTNVWFAYDVS
jgi:hypothetical protein